MERAYRATAHVTVLSVPVFSRSNVGYAVVTERIDQLTGSVGLAFVAGTFPKRTHGLNRLGYIRELVQEENNLPISASYIGLITKNQEESLKDARQSLDVQGVNSIVCYAASGRITGKVARSDVWQVQISAPANPRPDEVISLAQSVLTSTPQNAKHMEGTITDDSEQTFLYSVRESMLSGARFTTRPFVHNAKMFTLRTEKHVDVAVGRELQRAGLCDNPNKVIRLTGYVENTKTCQLTEFVVWFEEGGFMPLRFSYRPRPYLQLIFEAEQAATLPEPEVASTVVRRQ